VVWAALKADVKSLAEDTQKVWACAATDAEQANKQAKRRDFMKFP